jgi:hypothetical protein
MIICGILNPVYRPSGPLGFYYAPATGAFDPARSGSRAEIPALLEERNAKAQRRKDAKVLDAIEQDWRTPAAISSCLFCKPPSGDPQDARD